MLQQIHFLNVGLTIVVGNLSEEDRAFEFEPETVLNETGWADVDFSSQEQEGMAEVERMLDELHFNESQHLTNEVDKEKR